MYGFIEQASKRLGGVGRAPDEIVVLKLVSKEPLAQPTAYCPLCRILQSRHLEAHPVAILPVPDVE